MSDTEEPVTFSARKKRLSSTLSRFLGTQRTSLVPPAPEMEAPSTEFLAQFHGSFSASKNATTANDDNNKDDDDSQANSEDGSSSSAEESDAEAEHKQLAGKEIMDMQIPTTPFRFQHPDASASATPAEEVEARLRLFNLPWRLDPLGEELVTWARKLGVHFTTVGMEQKNGEFAGIAKVTAKLWTGKDKDKGKGKSVQRGHSDDEDDAEEGGDDDDEAAALKRLRVKVMKKLQGAECKGRPVKVRDDSHLGRTTRTSLGGGNRYWEKLENIHVKCNRCGEVGHMEKECHGAEKVMPCHLCAGNDHDAANCPNIVCFRCRDFGHHRGDCRATNAQIQKKLVDRYTGGYSTGMADARGTPLGMLCSQCGSIKHNSTFCPEVLNPKKYYEVEDTDTDKGGNSNCNKRSRKKSNSLETEALKIRSSNVDRNVDALCMVCGMMGHAICGNWPVIQVVRKFTNGDADTDSHSQHGKKRQKTSHSSSRSIRTSTSGDSDVEFVSQTVYQRGEMVTIYCPKCGQSGHHCDFPLNDRDDTCVYDLATQVQRTRQEQSRPSLGACYARGGSNGSGDGSGNINANGSSYNNNRHVVSTSQSSLNGGGGGGYGGGGRGIGSRSGHSVQIQQPGRFAGGRGSRFSQNRGGGRGGKFGRRLDYGY